MPEISTAREKLATVKTTPAGQASISPKTTNPSNAVQKPTATHMLANSHREAVATISQNSTVAIESVKLFLKSSSIS